MANDFVLIGMIERALNQQSDALLYSTIRYNALCIQILNRYVDDDYVMVASEKQPEIIQFNR